MQMDDDNESEGKGKDTTLTKDEMPVPAKDLDLPAIPPQQDMEAHGTTPICLKPHPHL